MKVNYEITKEDFIRYNIHYADNSKSHKIRMNSIRIITALCFGYLFSILWIMMFYYDYYICYYSNLVGVIGGLIWIFVYPKIYQLQIKNSAKNMIKEFQGFNLSKRSITIDEKNVIVESEVLTQIIKKRFIKQVKEYPDMILIYFEEMKVSFIPTRFLEGNLKECFLKELNSR